MIDPKTIDEIKLKADIVSVINRYVPLKKRGRNFLGNCPFHNEKTPSFTVSPEKGIFHCFGCGKSGNIFSFIREMEKVDFVQAVRILGEQCGVTIEEIKNERYEQNEILFAINAAAVEFFRQQLANNSQAQEYLRARNLNAETIKEFELGFAPDSWSALFDFLKAKFNPAKIEEAGLIGKKENGEYYDRFRKRLMFPIKNASGKTIAFSGRIIEKSDMAKYVNSPETPIFTKGNNLYGIHLAKRAMAKEELAILVEGQIDVVACHSAGFANTVASLGTAFTSNQARMLARYTNKVVIAYDKDEAGLTATDKTIEVLSALNFQIRILNIPEKDPDETIQKHGAEVLRQAILQAGDYIQYQLERILAKYDLQDKLQKSQAAQETVQLLRRLNNRVLETEYLKWLAPRLGVALEVLHEESRGAIIPHLGKGLNSSRKYISPPKDKYEKAEENLITAMLSDLSLRQQFFAQFGVEDIAKQWQELLKFLQQNELTDDKLIEDLEQKPELSGLREMISAQLLKADMNNLSGADCLQVLSDRKKEMRKKQLRAELMTAESAGDETKAAELAQVLQQLR